MTNIMAVRIDHRSKKAPTVQEVLTKHGCLIKLRVGSHETSTDFCAEDGIILLQLSAQNDGEVKALEADLAALGGVTVKTIEI